MTPLIGLLSATALLVAGVVVYRKLGRTDEIDMTLERRWLLAQAQRTKPYWERPTWEQE